MSARTLRRLAIVALFVAVASAAWLLERRPIVAAVLLVLVAGGSLAVWQLRRGERRVNAAALRCDVDALERMAGEGSSRIFATMALIHHGGFARARTRLCTCGECVNDAMDEELTRTARIVRAAYEGRGAEAYELALDLDPESKDVPPLMSSHVSQMRLLTRLVAYASAAEDGANRSKLPAEWVDLVVKLADTSWPIVRWPIRLAAAREAASRADAARAKAFLAGMPPWPDGSPLEGIRLRLLDA